MINSRNDFAEYCLRKLGKPVIRINVAAPQINDRIDEAIQVWQEKHFDATEKAWLGYKITAEDVVNGYITLPSDIHVVDQLIKSSLLDSVSGAGDLFSYRYQYMIQNMSPFQPMDMVQYYLTVTSINEINDLINTTERFEYTKHKNKLMIFRDGDNLKENMLVLLHVHKKINPDEDQSAWEDKWLKQYATALIKQQWGNNMKKHGEIQLLGGVTVNGQQIFDESVQEIQQLEEQLRDTYEEPVSFSVG
jgi:hypothetical protein